MSSLIRIFKLEKIYCPNCGSELNYALDHCTKCNSQFTDQTFEKIYSLMMRKKRDTLIINTAFLVMGLIFGISIVKFQANVRYFGIVALVVASFNLINCFIILSAKITKGKTENLNKIHKIFQFTMIFNIISGAIIFLAFVGFLIYLIIQFLNTPVS